MDTMKSFWARFTRCDSGDWLNPLMHLFLFTTAVFGIAFVFFGDTVTVQQSLLFMLSDDILGWNQFGLACLAAMISHSVSFILRGKWNLIFLPLAMMFGFFAWLYASILFIDAGLFYQFAVSCLPNLGFWAWYSWQFRRRATGKTQAFVH